MKFKGNYINGRFVLPRRDTRRFTSEDPGDLSKPLGEVVFSKDPVGDAVDAAQKASVRWSSLSLQERSRHILRFQKTLKGHAGELSLLITEEMGKTLNESKLEVERIGAKIDAALKYEMDLVRSSAHELGNGIRGTLQFRPRGVIAVLAPFNLPAHLAVSPVLSALLTGNTVVLKPSEITPFVGQFLALLWGKTGLPKGVFNLVQGTGDVGRELVGHPGIDGIFFTGSWQTGQKIQSQIQKMPNKICALEMGGKNSAIVLKDCDPAKATDEIFLGAFLTSGQRCNATSRILVERSVAGKFIPFFLKKVDQIKIGYGTRSGVFMGPLASKKVFERARMFVKKARSEGFEVLKEGGILDYEKKGYYLKPSVHLRIGEPPFPVKDQSYTDSEILGPDAAIYVVKDLEEAIRINNRPPYGLVVSVFTRSRKNYEKVLREAQDGLINWNVSTVRTSSRLPFGGLKRSGNNRPGGFFSPYHCTIPTASLEKKT